MKANSKTYQLVLNLPDSEPILCRLEGKRVRLGRGDGNQIQIPLKSISSIHCEFRVDEDAGRCDLVDLGSTNGTRVNGSTVKDSSFALRHGDQILLGDAVTAQFIAAIEAVVAERQSKSDSRDATKPIGRAVNPVAAAIAKQQAALRSERDLKRKKRRKSGAFRLF